MSAVHAFTQSVNVETWFSIEAPAPPVMTQVLGTGACCSAWEVPPSGSWDGSPPHANNIIPAMPAKETTTDEDLASVRQSGTPPSQTTDNMGSPFRRGSKRAPAGGLVAAKRRPSVHRDDEASAEGTPQIHSPEWIQLRTDAGRLSRFLLAPAVAQPE
jgi:hypothetical protein